MAKTEIIKYSPLPQQEPNETAQLQSQSRIVRDRAKSAFGLAVFSFLAGGSTLISNIEAIAHSYPANELAFTTGLGVIFLAFGAYEVRTGIQLLNDSSILIKAASLRAAITGQTNGIGGPVVKATNRRSSMQTVPE